MPESHINKLAKIDARLQLLNEERLALINERQTLIMQHETELAKNFNLHASPEAKIDLFLSYFKGRSDVYPLDGNLKMVAVVILLLVGMSGSQKFVTNQK